MGNELAKVNTVLKDCPGCCSNTITSVKALEFVHYNNRKISQ